MKANSMARFGSIIDCMQCSLLGMRLVLNQATDGSYAYVQVHGHSVDPRSREGHYVNWTGRKWLLSVHMTETEVVNTCLLALTQAAMHELHEAITYKGKPVFDPHVAVWERLGYVEPERDVRPTAINGA